MKNFLGILLIIISLFMLLGFIKSNTEHELLVRVITFILAVVIPFSSGFGLLLSNYKQKKLLDNSKGSLANKILGSEILKLAEKNNAKLTVLEVVKELSVESNVAQEILDAFVAKNFAEIELTESGIIVYSFVDIQRLNEKEFSKGVLDA